MFHRIQFKKLAFTGTPPTTQKARGVWKLMRQNTFEGFRAPTEVWLGMKTVHSDDPKDVVEGKTFLPHVVGGYLAKFQSDCKDKPGLATEPFSDSCPACHNGLPSWPFKGDKELMGRPCPVRPTHGGFVSSRPVKSLDEAVALFKEALQKDPQAEILVMPLIRAKWSAVYVPESGALVIGPNHDGATAGYESITFPVGQQEVAAEWKKEIAIADGEHVYVELVMGNDYQPVAVQARSGPPIPVGSKEFIPRKMQVGSIITPSSEDLSAWEEVCKSVAGMKGLVAVQVGGSLASHAAIHAFSNDIPFLTHRVEVGDWIKPDSSTPAFDLKEFQLGALIAQSRSDFKEELLTAIPMLHNMVRLKAVPEYSRLLGYASTVIYRAAAAACLGEGRHYKGSMLGEKNKPMIYGNASGLDSHELCTRLAGFSYRFLAQSWSGGFGGWPWFVASVQAVKLWDCISAGNHMKTLEVANVIVNLAHNGGWLLNKFCNAHIMNECTKQPGSAMAKRMGYVMDICKATAPENSDAVIRPRKYRTSHKWIVVPKSIYHIEGSKKKTTNLVINKMETQPLQLGDEFRRTMEDMFEYV